MSVKSRVTVPVGRSGMRTILVVCKDVLEEFIARECKCGGLYDDQGAGTDQHRA